MLRELSGLSSCRVRAGGRQPRRRIRVLGFAHDIDTALLAEMVETLNSIAAGRPGVTVETKPASVALHVRNASDADGAAALALATEAAGSWDAHTTAGKAVLEFAVIVTDKGEAIDILREPLCGNGSGLPRR